MQYLSRYCLTCGEQRNRLEDKPMKPMSLAGYLSAMLVLGISLLWFPDMVAIAGAWFPVGTPTYLIDFVAAIPWIALSAILILVTVKFLRRGSINNKNNEDRG